MLFRVIMGKQDKDLTPATRRNLHTLAIATLATVAAFSLISHKEWRFLHPILPILLLFAARGLVSAYEPIEGGLLQSPWKTLCAGLRVRSAVVLWLTLVPLGPWIYVTFWHGRGQVAVTEWLGAQHLENTETMRVMALMPCHSIPWMSHIHVTELYQELNWNALTCEPPIK